MRRRVAAVILILGFSGALLAQQPAKQPAGNAADLVLVNTKVWTGEPTIPWATAVAIRGNRILRVGKQQDIEKLIQKGYTRVLDLKDRLVLPGFIDNHTHFAQAGRLLLGLNLLDVNDAENFRKRVSEASARLPRGSWLLGGDWGAYAQWGKGSAGQSEEPSRGEAGFLPSKKLIDSVTGDHAALISRFDRELFLANSLALKAAGITRDTPDPDGGEIVRDADGEPTGLLRGAA